MIKKTKNILILIAVIVFFLPFFIFDTDNEQDLVETVITISNDNFILADDVNPEYTAGDLYSVSNSLKINKRFDGDIFGIASSIFIENTISDDLKFISFKTEISSNVLGSTIGLGEYLEVKEDAYLKYGLYFLGENLVFDGKTDGDLVFKGEKISITENAHIKGNVIINTPSDETVSIADGVVIGGERSINEGISEENSGGVYTYYLIGLISLIALGFLIGIIFENKERWSIWSYVNNNSGISFIYGLLSIIILIPLLIVIFIVNSFVGMVGMLIYLGIFAFAVFYLITALADFLQQKIGKEWNFGVYTALSVVIITILISIPYVEFLVYIAWLFILGALLRKLVERI